MNKRRMIHKHTEKSRLNYPFDSKLRFGFHIFQPYKKSELTEFFGLY